jgi:hypothetical protein
VGKKIKRGSVLIEKKDWYLFSWSEFIQFSLQGSPMNAELLSGGSNIATAVSKYPLNMLPFRPG